MEKLIRFGALIFGVIFVGAAVSEITIAKIDKLKEAQMFASVDVISVKDRERQLDCLAKNIYHEAKGESFEGKVAVAQVTMNRAESGKFPKDVCGVVYQKNVFMERVVCQFSWYCQNSGKLQIQNAAMYDESYKVAKKVLLENFRLDTMKDALYYHADYVNPQWRLEKIGKIGRHIFYRDSKNGKS